MCIYNYYFIFTKYHDIYIWLYICVYMCRRVYIMRLWNSELTPGRRRRVDALAWAGLGGVSSVGLSSSVLAFDALTSVVWLTGTSNRYVMEQYQRMAKPIKCIVQKDQDTFMYNVEMECRSKAISTISIPKFSRNGTYYYTIMSLYIILHYYYYSLLNVLKYIIITA